MSFFNSYLFIFLFLVLVLGLWAFGLWLTLYYTFWWYDIVAHFLGGVWVASSALILKQKLGLEASGRFNKFTIFLSVVAVVVLAGVLWEFVELIGDRYVFQSGFTYLPGTYEDTLLDLFIDLVGGLAGYLIYRKHA